MRRAAVTALVAALVAFLGGWAFVAARLHQVEAARAAQWARAAALGASLAGAFEAMPVFGGEPLARACEGKLPPGPPHAVLLYTLPLPPGLRPHLDGERIDGTAIGVSGSLSYLGHTPIDPPPGPPPVLDRLGRYAQFVEWPRFLEGSDLELEQLRSLRYLVVAELTDLRPAALREAGDFDPGRARYRARVVRYPDGAPLCEGVGEARMARTVIGHAKADSAAQAESEARHVAERKLQAKWIDATLASPIEDVCAAGGPRLCELAHLATDPPDW